MLLRNIHDQKLWCEESSQHANGCIETVTIMDFAYTETAILYFFKVRCVDKHIDQ